MNGYTVRRSVALFITTLLIAPIFGVSASAEALPDLRVDLGDSPDPVASGGQVFYEVEGWNDGDDLTSGVVKLTTQLPAGVAASDVTVAGTFGAACSVTDRPSGALVTCVSSGGLFDGMAVNLRVRVPSGATSLLTTARIDPDNTIREARETNNTKTVSTSVTSENTPPDTFASHTPPTHAGWSTSDITVTLAAADAGSGVREINYRAFGGQVINPTKVLGASTSFMVSQEGETTISYFAVDNAGNVEPTDVLIVRLDKTKPVVDCGVPAAEWSADDVSVACTASDSVSGLAGATDAAFTLSTSVPDGTETDSASTGDRSVCDVAGNCSPAGPFEGLKVDKKAPVIDLVFPDDTSLVLNQPVESAFTCSDGGSGVAACDGNAVDTSTVGTKVVSVTAIDNVGNTNTKSVAYTVSYDLCDVSDLSKPVNAGSTMSLKLSVCDFNGVNLSSRNLAVTSMELVPASVGASASSQFSLGGPSNDFRYSGGKTGGHYSRNLSTKGLTSGTYALMISAAGDPVMHSVTFQVRGEMGALKAAALRVIKKGLRALRHAG